MIKAIFRSHHQMPLKEGTECHIVSFSGNDQGVIGCICVYPNGSIHRHKNTQLIVVTPFVAEALEKELIGDEVPGVKDEPNAEGQPLNKKVLAKEKAVVQDKVTKE